MEKRDLDYFHDLLRQWLDDLEHHADDTVEGLLEIGEYLADPIDQASFESDRNLTLRIRDRENMLIKKIRKSLEDIENGVYGICEDCGEEISVARLRARPVAKRCIRCKTKQEKWEKITGS